MGQNRQTIGQSTPNNTVPKLTTRLSAKIKELFKVKLQAPLEAPSKPEAPAKLPLSTSSKSSLPLSTSSNSSLPSSTPSPSLPPPYPPVGDIHLLDFECDYDPVQRFEQKIFDLLDSLYILPSVLSIIIAQYRGATLAFRATPERLHQFEEMAKAGDPVAQAQLGYWNELGICGFKKNFVEAHKWYELSSTQDYGDGLAGLGNLYLLGHHVKHDLNEGYRLVSLSIVQGSARGIGLLAYCYDIGAGIKRDLQETIRLFHMSANLGDTESQCALAYCYTNGEGVIKNLEIAFHLYKAAGQRGYGLAQNSLAVCYEKGRGVKEDIKEGLRYFHLSVEQGHAIGQYNLAKKYEYGMCGLKIDKIKALELYRLSAVQGDVDAKEKVRILESENRLYSQE